MDNLRQMREAIGYTRIHLARESGISRWRLAMVETEGHQLSTDEAEAVRKVLRPELVKLAHSVLEFQAAGGK